MKDEADELAGGAVVIVAQKKVFVARRCASENREAVVACGFYQMAGRL